MKTQCRVFIVTRKITLLCFLMVLIRVFGPDIAGYMLSSLKSTMARLMLAGRSAWKTTRVVIQIIVGFFL